MNLSKKEKSKLIRFLNKIEKINTVYTLDKVHQFFGKNNFIGEGSFRDVFEYKLSKKKVIVIKVSNDQDHNLSEYYRYKTISKKNKKFFAKPLAISKKGSALAMEKVKCSSFRRPLTNRQFTRLNSALDDEALDVFDFDPGHNVGLRNRTPVIYDYQDLSGDF